MSADLRWRVQYPIAVHMHSCPDVVNMQLEICAWHTQQGRVVLL